MILGIFVEQYSISALSYCYDDYMMGIAVEVTRNSNRVHLVEVALEKGEPTKSFDTKVSPSFNNDSPSALTLLQQVIDVKNGKLSLDDVSAVGIDSKPSTDSEGRKLSPDQQEYFKDSKVRDEDGNLLVVYHGTDADFTVFDKTKGRSGMNIQGSFC